MEHGLLPWNHLKLQNKYLVTTSFGGWCILTSKEFHSFLHNKIDETLRKKLEDSQIILTSNNVEDVIKRYKGLKRLLFQGPSLHIISVTEQCNHNCIYCQANYTKGKKGHMNEETAMKVLEFIFETPSKAIAIEFQGGEPLLNWKIVKLIIEEAERLNESYEKKDLRFSLVSNLSILDKEKLDFLVRHRVGLCTSLDGPSKVHNANRKFINGEGSYQKLTEKMKMVKDVFDKYKLKFYALLTVTAYSLPYWKEIIDEYVKWGFDIIHLRFLNKLGKAKENWKEIGYTPEEFFDFWKKSMDYILELNKKGVLLKERMSFVMLQKILKGEDPGYTELMSPCGAGITQLLYNYNGNIYTCDEARMLGEDMFLLGNVHTHTYKEVIRSENLVATCYASLIENYCERCVFRSWCGTCPVINYATEGGILPKITQTFRCKVYKKQFAYLFNKIQNPENLEIFKRWINED